MCIQKLYKNIISWNEAFLSGFIALYFHYKLVNTSAKGVMVSYPIYYT